jgi:hypothetical protein
MPYYRAVKPEIGWEWMLAVGVLIGGCISAFLSGDIGFETAPPALNRGLFHDSDIAFQ